MTRASISADDEVCGLNQSTSFIKVWQFAVRKDDNTFHSFTTKFHEGSQRIKQKHPPQRRMLK
jgi:hypothetical protein